MTATGPYVVTHRQQNDQPCETCMGAQGIGLCVCPDSVVLYREAFATLEELPDIPCQKCAYCRKDEGDCGWPYILSRLPESGGKLDPLPDGSVIEVEATTWEALVLATPVKRRYAHGVPLLPPSVWLDSNRASCCAAWNAEHGIGLEARAC